MEEFEIEFKELDQFEIEDTREVVIQEVPVFPDVVDLEVTPSKETQTFKEDSINYGEVKVLGDEDLQASNIKQGVEIFGVTGSLEELTTETKEGINNQEEIITNQETTLEEINVALNNKVLVKEKYKPRYIYNGISFRNYTGTELDHETQMLDTTYITNMSYMFAYCSNLISLDLSSWNTSNVTNMNSMFYYSKNITELNLSNWNNDNVTNMSNMFNNCDNLSKLNLTSFKTNNVTNLYGMFQGCKKLTTLDLSNWNTSKVDNMESMFRDCQTLTELNLTNWNTSNVTTMSNMFSYLYNITSLDLSSFDTSNVTDMGFMFYQTTKLKYLDIRNFTFDKVTSMNVVFSGVPKDCLIIVKGQTEKDWVLARNNSFTNIKTIAELEG